MGQQLLEHRELFMSGEKRTAEYKRSVKREALRQHIIALAEQQGTGVNLLHGTVTISIPSFFSVAAKEHPDKFDNPVNTAALSTLPEIRLNSTRGYTYDRYNQVVSAGALTKEQAIRLGKAPEWLVATELDLPSFLSERDHVIINAAAGLTSVVNSGIVGELPDIARIVREKGYVDFLDYLIDAKSGLDAAVETHFEQGLRRRHTL